MGADQSTEKSKDGIQSQHEFFLNLMTGAFPPKEKDFIQHLMNAHDELCGGTEWLLTADTRLLLAFFPISSSTLNAAAATPSGKDTFLPSFASNNSQMSSSIPLSLVSTTAMGSTTTTTTSSSGPAPVVPVASLVLHRFVWVIRFCTRLLHWHYQTLAAPWRMQTSPSTPSSLSRRGKTADGDGPEDTSPPPGREGDRAVKESPRRASPTTAGMVDDTCHKRENEQDISIMEGVNPEDSIRLVEAALFFAELVFRRILHSMQRSLGALSAFLKQCKPLMQEFVHALLLVLFDGVGNGKRWKEGRPSLPLRSSPLPSSSSSLSFPHSPLPPSLFSFTGSSMPKNEFLLLHLGIMRWLIAFHATALFHSYDDNDDADEGEESLEDDLEGSALAVRRDHGGGNKNRNGGETFRKDPLIHVLLSSSWLPSLMGLLLHRLLEWGHEVQTGRVENKEEDLGRMKGVGGVETNTVKTINTTTAAATTTAGKGLSSREESTKQAEAEEERKKKRNTVLLLHHYIDPLSKNAVKRQSKYRFGELPSWSILETPLAAISKAMSFFLPANQETAPLHHNSTTSTNSISNSNRVRSRGSSRRRRYDRLLLHSKVNASNGSISTDVLQGNNEKPSPSRSLHCDPEGALFSSPSQEERRREVIEREEQDGDDDDDDDEEKEGWNGSKGGASKKRMTIMSEAESAAVPLLPWTAVQPVTTVRDALYRRSLELLVLLPLYRRGMEEEDRCHTSSMLSTTTTSSSSSSTSPNRNHDTGSGEGAILQNSAEEEKMQGVERRRNERLSLPPPAPQQGRPQKAAEPWRTEGRDTSSPSLLSSFLSSGLKKDSHSSVAKAARQAFSHLIFSTLSGELEKEEESGGGTAREKNCSPFSSPFFLSSSPHKQQGLTQQEDQEHHHQEEPEEERGILRTLALLESMAVHFRTCPIVGVLLYILLVDHPKVISRLLRVAPHLPSSPSWAWINQPRVSSGLAKPTPSEDKGAPAAVRSPSSFSSLDFSSLMEKIPHPLLEGEGREAVPTSTGTHPLLRGPPSSPPPPPPSSSLSPSEEGEKCLTTPTTPRIVMEKPCVGSGGGGGGLGAPPPPRDSRRATSLFPHNNCTNTPPAECVGGGVAAIETVKESASPPNPHVDVFRTSSATGTERNRALPATTKQPTRKVCPCRDSSSPQRSTTTTTTGEGGGEVGLTAVQSLVLVVYGLLEFMFVTGDRSCDPVWEAFEILPFREGYRGSNRGINTAGRSSGGTPHLDISEMEKGSGRGVEQPSSLLPPSSSPSPFPPPTSLAPPSFHNAPLPVGHDAPEGVGLLTNTVLTSTTPTLSFSSIPPSIPAASASSIGTPPTPALPSSTSALKMCSDLYLDQLLRSDGVPLAYGHMNVLCATLLFFLSQEPLLNRLLFRISVVEVEEMARGICLNQEKYQRQQMNSVESVPPPPVTFPPKAYKDSMSMGSLAVLVLSRRFYAMAASVSVKQEKEDKVGENTKSISPVAQMLLCTLVNWSCFAYDISTSTSQCIVQTLLFLAQQLEKERKKRGGAGGPGTVGAATMTTTLSTPAPVFLLKKWNSNGSGEPVLSHPSSHPRPPSPEDGRRQGGEEEKKEFSETGLPLFCSLPTSTTTRAAMTTGLRSQIGDEEEEDEGGGKGKRSHGKSPAAPVPQSRNFPTEQWNKDASFGEEGEEGERGGGGEVEDSTNHTPAEVAEGMWETYLELYVEVVEGMLVGKQRKNLRLLYELLYAKDKLLESVMLHSSPSPSVAAGEGSPPLHEGPTRESFSHSTFTDVLPTPLQPTPLNSLALPAPSTGYEGRSERVKPRSNHRATEGSGCECGSGEGEEIQGEGVEERVLAGAEHSLHLPRLTNGFQSFLFSGYFAPSVTDASTAMQNPSQPHEPSFFHSREVMREPSFTTLTLGSNVGPSPMHPLAPPPSAIQSTIPSSNCSTAGISSSSLVYSSRNPTPPLGNTERNIHQPSTLSTPQRPSPPQPFSTPPLFHASGNTSPFHENAAFYRTVLRSRKTEEDAEWLKRCRLVWEPIIQIIQSYSADIMWDSALTSEDIMERIAKTAGEQDEKEEKEKKNATTAHSPFRWVTLKGAEGKWQSTGEEEEEGDVDDEEEEEEAEEEEGETEPSTAEDSHFGNPPRQRPSLSSSIFRTQNFSRFIHSTSFSAPFRSRRSFGTEKQMECSEVGCPSEPSPSCLEKSTSLSGMTPNSAELSRISLAFPLDHLPSEDSSFTSPSRQRKMERKGIDPPPPPHHHDNHSDKITPPGVRPLRRRREKVGKDWIVYKYQESPESYGFLGPLVWSLLFCSIARPGAALWAHSVQECRLLMQLSSPE